MGLRCLAICFDWHRGIGSCGQVNSVCIAIETNDFWLRCVVEVFEPETTEAAVRLEDVIVDCSERAAFLASGNEIPRSTFICCTLFQVPFGTLS